eukprot:5618-Eustigmatos_ZCMA.PRE.1
MVFTTDSPASSSASISIPFCVRVSVSTVTRTLGGLSLIPVRAGGGVCVVVVPLPEGAWSC